MADARHGVACVAALRCRRDGVGRARRNARRSLLAEQLRLRGIPRSCRVRVSLLSCMEPFGGLRRHGAANRGAFRVDLGRRALSQLSLRARLDRRGFLVLDESDRLSPPPELADLERTHFLLVHDPQRDSGIRSRPRAVVWTDSVSHPGRLLVATPEANSRHLLWMKVGKSKTRSSPHPSRSRCESVAECRVRVAGGAEAIQRFSFRFSRPSRPIEACLTS